MADQQAVTVDPLDPAFDWREREKKRQEEREAQDRANREDPAYVEFLEAYGEAVGKRAAAALGAVAKELGKRPVLKEIIASTAAELDTVFWVVSEWPNVKRRLGEGSDLPSETARLIRDMPEIRKDTGAGAQLTIAEIVVKRDAVSRMWERLESLDAKLDKDRENADLAAERDHAYSEANRGSFELHWEVLTMIADGRVPGRAAAVAVMGSREITVEAVTDARQEGAEV